MESLSYKLNEFNKPSVDDMIVKSKAKGAIYGEYFYDSYSDKVQTVTFYNNNGEFPSHDSSCSWDYAGLHC